MALQRLSATAYPETIHLGGFKIGVFKSMNKLTTDLIDCFDALILDNIEMMYQVRATQTCYLIPIFTRKRELIAFCDGKYNESELTGLEARIMKLNERISQTRRADHNNGEQNSIRRMLAYLHSRNISLDPSSGRLSPVGYAYPFYQVFHPEHNVMKSLKELQKLEDKSLIDSLLVDKVNICYSCQSSYLNFSECCSKCGSRDVEFESLVHHFRCAYIGPESDFKNDGKLVCPKCDKQLKHIGIDYDKPSEISNCNACSHKSQETSMKAKCVDCGFENKIDQLTSIDIKSFELTSDGIEYVLNHKESRTEEVVGRALFANKQFYEHEQYKLIRSHELLKSKHLEGLVFEMDIRMPAQLIKNLSDQNYTHLLFEIADILSTYIKMTDVVAYHNKNISILLLAYDDNSIKNLYDLISYNIKKLISDNIESLNEAVIFELKQIED